MAMAARLAVLLPRLNERDRRVALGAEARSWGYGGIAEVHRATGVARSTIKQGLRDLEAAAGPPNMGRVRAVGGGRRRAEVANPELADALDSLIEPETR